MLSQNIHKMRVENLTWDNTCHCILRLPYSHASLCGFDLQCLRLSKIEDRHRESSSY